MADLASVSVQVALAAAQAGLGAAAERAHGARAARHRLAGDIGGMRAALDQGLRECRCVPSCQAGISYSTCIVRLEPCSRLQPCSLLIEEACGCAHAHKSVCSTFLNRKARIICKIK